MDNIRRSKVNKKNTKSNGITQNIKWIMMNDSSVRWSNLPRTMMVHFQKAAEVKGVRILASIMPIITHQSVNVINNQKFAWQTIYISTTCFLDAIDKSRDGYHSHVEQWWHRSGLIRLQVGHTRIIPTSLVVSIGKPRHEIMFSKILFLSVSSAALFIRSQSAAERLN